MPKVSTVIPTYNRAISVAESIDSALNQTLDELELIVVDDASTDDTVSVLESYGDRIRYRCHEENRGGSAARNTGIEIASGEYIAFLDSDDTWHPTKLEKQVRCLEERGQAWVASYCQVEQKRSNRLVEWIDNRVQRPNDLEGGAELIPAIMMRQFAHGGSSTLLVKRSAIGAIGGFDEQFQRHQDVEFLIRLLQHGKLAHVDEPLVSKHDTGNPPIDAVESSSRRFVSEFEDLISELESEGYDVRGVQRFRLAKHYLAAGHLTKGIRHAATGTCPHVRDYLGLVRSLGIGIRSITGRNF